MSLRRVLAPLAAVLLVGVGAVAGAVLVGSDTAGLAVSAANDVDATATEALASAGSPTQPDADATTIPTEWLDDVEFYDYLGGFRLPWSPTAGPALRADNLASVFAHTPMGAVVAGPNIATRVQGTLGAPVWVPTVENQVVGPYKAYVSRAAQSSSRPDVPAPGELIAASDGRFVGWQWVSYRDDVAVVRHLLTQGSGDGIRYLTLDIQTRWVEGDWRVVAPDNGDWISEMAEVPDSNGFELYTQAT